ncbi:MAG TPA: glycosyltransferase family 4 protein [Longimicrobiales bacterium]
MTERSLRLLIVVNHYPPDVNPSGKLMHQLALGLRELGHTVDVLTTFPHYQSFRTEPGYRGRLFAREHGAGGRVTRVWAFASGQKQRMLHRLANYVSFNALASIAGPLTRARYDVVLANSGSFFTGITGWLIRVLRRTPFIYNVQDIYPDVPVRAGQLRNLTAIRALEAIERFMYDRAARITVISNEQRSVLMRKGVAGSKVTVIPNFVDTAFIRPLPKDNEVSRRLGLHDKFVIAHAGNLGYAYDFASMLDTAAALTSMPDVQFVIIGEGVLRERLADQIAQRGLTNVSMLPFQPEADLPNLRAALDVQLSLYAKGSVQSSLPSKIYEIMASGRPALVSAERGSDLYNLVTATGCGICIEPQNTAQLTEAIRTLHQDRAQGDRLGKQGRDAVERSFSKEAAVAAYARLISDIDKAVYAKQ